jgi:hypothetical protein
MAFERTGRGRSNKLEQSEQGQISCELPIINRIGGAGDRLGIVDSLRSASEQERERECSKWRPED